MKTKDAKTAAELRVLASLQDHCKLLFSSDDESIARAAKDYAIRIDHMQRAIEACFQASEVAA